MLTLAEVGHSMTVKLEMSSKPDFIRQGILRKGTCVCEYNLGS